MIQIRPTILLALLSLVLLAPVSPAFAQEPFLGEIRWVGFNFAPRGWAECDGQMMQISQHQALFSLLGTIYGGDGRTTFALPDMRGRMQIHEGSGPGLSNRRQGERSGEESHTLTQLEMPVHRHDAMASEGQANSRLPNDRVLASPRQHRHSSDEIHRRSKIYGDEAANVIMDESAIADAGGGQPHGNMPPYLAMKCVIALQGIYPSRN